MKRLNFILVLLISSYSLFGQRENDSLPDILISLTTGINFIHSELNTYNINETYVYSEIPPQNTLLEIDGSVNTHDNIGFYTNLIFKNKIMSYSYNELFYTIGFTYKYLTTMLDYSTYESHSDAPDIKGNGNVIWREQYLSPVIGISLYSRFGKKIYIENNIDMDYNFLLYGKANISYTGEKYIQGQNGWPLSFNRKYKEKYSRKNSVYSHPAIAHRLDLYYITGLNYQYKQNRLIGIQVILPFPNIIYGFILDKNQKNKVDPYIPVIGNFAEPWYQKLYYKQILISLTLNIFLK